MTRQSKTEREYRQSAGKIISRINRINRHTHTHTKRLPMIELVKGKTVISIPLGSPARSLSRSILQRQSGVLGSSFSDLGSTTSRNELRSEYTDDVTTTSSRAVPQQYSRHTTRTFLSTGLSRGFETIISPVPFADAGGNAINVNDEDRGNLPLVTLNAEDKSNAVLLPPSPGQHNRRGLPVDGEDSRSASSVASLQQELRQSGRYIARLEQRLAALQRKAASESNTDTGDKRLHAVVLASADAYRERVRLATSSGGVIRNSEIGMTDGLSPVNAKDQWSSLVVKSPGGSPAHGGDNSRATLEDTDDHERLLECKRAELEAQEMQLVAWAQELRAKEAALEQVVASLRGQPVEPQKKDEDGPAVRLDSDVGSDVHATAGDEDVYGQLENKRMQSSDGNPGIKQIEDQWTEEMEKVRFKFLVIRIVKCVARWHLMSILVVFACAFSHSRVSRRHLPAQRGAPLVSCVCGSHVLTLHPRPPLFGMRITSFESPHRRRPKGFSTTTGKGHRQHQGNELL